MEKREMRTVFLSWGSSVFCARVQKQWTENLETLLFRMSRSRKHKRPFLFSTRIIGYCEGVMWCDCRLDQHYGINPMSRLDKVRQGSWQFWLFLRIIWYEESRKIRCRNDKIHYYNRSGRSGLGKSRKEVSMHASFTNCTIRILYRK